MAITSGLFNSINGDRKYNATWFARYFATFIGNGVFPNPSTGLQVYENENMTTVVKAGDGWINGYFIVNDTDYVLQHDNADGVLKRIDRIVMRLNYLTRTIEIVIKKGAFASAPTAPTLQHDADYHELALADVLINNGATAITQANITDQRLNNEVCGVVHGLVDQVDTTTIFNQYQAWFTQITSGTESEIQTWQTQQEQEFNAWFITIQDILDGDVAGNLANRITTLEGAVTVHSNDTTKHLIVGERDKWNDAVAATDIYKTIRSGKDVEGVFTNVTLKRRADDTIYMTSVLSGGTAPNYTTRTLTRYDTDGLTVVSALNLTLTYDSDGDWTGIA